jgi:uncharacterized protein YgfB (UPF0149 family)
MDETSVECEALEFALSQLGAVIEAPECHGALVGRLLATPWSEDGFPAALSTADWVMELLNEADVQLDEASAKAPDTARALGILEETWAATVAALLDPDNRFAPVLPDDERPLGLRARALGEWCAGFLSGLAEGGGLAGTEVSDDAREIIGDFIEITRIEPSPLRDNDAESAFMELVEYVRAGTMLVAEELGTFASMEPASAEPPTLH